MPKDQTKDLEYRPLEDLSWASAQRAVSLDKVFKYVSGQAQQAITWYLSKKNSKRKWAQVLRLGAILATTVAGIIPLLSEIFVSDGKPDISPAWASVALILAVALVGLDRFFGFSSAWMRFMTTELKIRNTLQSFQMDWEMQKASWKSPDPTDEQTQDMLAQCKTFLGQVNAFLEKEMAEWIREFRTALKQIDEAVKAQAEVARLGGANITVANGDQCPEGWELTIDDGTPGHHRGRTAALRDIVPGIHTIRAEGEINGKKLGDEKAVAISAGSPAEVELELT